ncbi:MAG: glycoside hydrolase family 3 protein [Spirochaetaceae bacterium]|nr:glycoside hydrolase family 3 protein [Spirochaetaceae bacterium]
MKYLCLILCVLCCSSSLKSEEVDLIAQSSSRLLGDFQTILEEAKEYKGPPPEDNYVYREATKKEVVAQLFMCGFDGEADFDQAAKESFGDIWPGALLFFQKNCGKSPEELIRFTEKIYSMYEERNLPAPFLVIDNEGGDVNRLRNIAAPLPSAELVSRYFSEKKAKALYEHSARQLRALGFHINLAPVIEVKTEDNAEFLGTRSFGDLEAVQKYGEIFAQAQLDNGILPVFKHFPGNTNVDPHHSLPVLDVTEEELVERYFPPFQYMGEKFPNAGVLMSHVSVPSVAPNVPAAFSAHLIMHYLQSVFGFRGLIISDDLQMDAMKNVDFSYYKDAADENSDEWTYMANADGSLESLCFSALFCGVNMIMLSKPEDFKTLINNIALGCYDDLGRAVSVSARKVLEKKREMGLVTGDENGALVNVPLEDFDTRLKKFKESRKASLKIYKGK